MGKNGLITMVCGKSHSENWYWKPPSNFSLIRMITMSASWNRSSRKMGLPLRPMIAFRPIMQSVWTNISFVRFFPCWHRWCSTVTTRFLRWWTTGCCLVSWRKIRPTIRTCSKSLLFKYLIISPGFMRFLPRIWLSLSRSKKLYGIISISSLEMLRSSARTSFALTGMAILHWKKVKILSQIFLKN